MVFIDRIDRGKNINRLYMVAVTPTPVRRMLVPALAGPHRLAGHRAKPETSRRTLGGPRDFREEGNAGVPRRKDRGSGRTVATAERARARAQRIVFWRPRKTKTHMQITAVTSA